MTATAYGHQGLVTAQRRKRTKGSAGTTRQVARHRELERREVATMMSPKKATSHGLRLPRITQ